MTLANITTPLLGVVGTAVIGNLGQAHLLGAVAISAVVFDSIFWLFGFLRMGTVALTAQALGARDRSEQDAVLARALLIAAVLGLALIVLQAPLAWASYAFMGASAEVTRAAETYFAVRIWSAPFTLGNYVVLGWLLGLARAATALALQVLVNLVNMVLTLWLVLGLDLGVAGAALATLVAEGAGFSAGLAIALRRTGRRFDPAIVLDRAKLVRLLVVNRDMMIRSAAVIIAFSFFAAQGARAGDTVLAANAVLSNLFLVGAYFLDGFATAAEQLCGRAVGARDRTAFMRATRLVLGWGGAFGLATTLLILLAGPALIALMTTSPEVRALAADFLLLAALAPAFGVFAFAYDGIYAGATWTRDMRNLMVVALALYFAIWWLTAPLGNLGLWLAFLTFFAARGIMQALRYPQLVKLTFKN